MTEIREFLLTLIRGDKITAAEITDHIQRLHRLGATLPEGWNHAPSELRGMERDGLIKREGEGWLTVIPPAAKPKQETLF